METLQKFKDLVGAGGQEKPEPAPAVPAAEKAAEHDEAAAAAAAAATEGAPTAEEPLDQAEVEQMLFDECLGAQNYTYEEFLELIDQPEEERGETADEKKHWSYPRRWKVVLWNLQIQNYMDDRLSAFIEFEFGGSREECKVRKGNSSRIYAKGEDKNYLRTPVASDMKSNEPVDLHFRKAFEYRGSYLDLEREKLKIKVWEYKNWTLNHLEAIFEEALLGFATGETHVERDLYKFVKGRRARRCRISFHLYFQELYDFEFSFLKWRLVHISSTNSLQNRVQGRTRKKSWHGQRAKTMASGTRRLMDQAKYAMQQRQVKKEMNKRSSRELLSGFQSKGPHSQRSRAERGTTLMKEGEAQGQETELDRENKKEELEKRASQTSSQPVSGRAEGLARRGRSVLFNLNNEDSAAQPQPVPAEGFAKDGKAGGSVPHPRNSMQVGETEALDDLLLAHMNTILLSDESTDLPLSASGHVSGQEGGLEARGGNATQPTVRMTISLLHASAMNKGMSVVSAELPNTLTPKWDNLGEIYFRGTLRDLDSTYLQIVVEDMSAPRVVRQIGYGQLPLRGVVDYPFLRTELVAPTWLSLQAKVEGWSEDLEKWRFGFVEGSVKIPHIPRYRQVGDVYEADSSRIYLVIRVKDVDQIITPDNRPAVDCYVEASFDGTARRTRIVRNTLNPTWDDEITIPLRLPPSRDITVPHLTRKGKVWLDVWGIGQGYVDHLGGCSFSLYEIFFNEKQSRRGLVPKERIDLESNTRQTYETRVLSTSRRLSFIYKDDRPSTLQFEAWTCPHLLEVSGLERLQAPEKYSSTSTLPEALQMSYDSLKKMWSEVIECKNLLDSEAEIGPPRYFDVEYLDQRKEARYLPTTMNRIRPPLGVESESAVFHYIRCVPFAIKKENLVYTPEFTMQLKAGNAFDHAILMASLLSGLPRYAFVCIGTLWDKQFHAWVASFHYDTEKGSAIVKFWETTTGNVYTLKNRFFRPHVLLKLDGRAVTDMVPTGGPKLPYRSIDIMFNERNVWLNLQDPNPSRVWFDIWRMDMWYPFSPGLHDLRPCFITRGFGARLPAWQFERASQEIRDKVIQDITAFRGSRNLPTKWNRDDILEAFLQTGLELLHQAATAREDDYRLAKLKLEEWRKAFYSKVPSSYRVRGAPLHFNTMDSKTISDSIIKSVEFVECRDRTASFSLGIVLFNLPGELVSTYVYTCLSQKVTERERRRIFAQREEASREEALRKARKKQGAAGKALHTEHVEENKGEETKTTGAQQKEPAQATAGTAVGAAGIDVKQAEEQEAATGEQTKKKKKKRVVKKGNIPKVKKRFYEEVEGCETAAIVISRDYYHEDGEPPDFKQLMTDTETAINDVLDIPPGRVRAFQARYAEKKLIFAVGPPSDDGGPSAAALLEKLGPLLSELATQEGPFQSLTGGCATVEWGGPGTKILDILQSGQGETGSPDEHEKEVQKALLEGFTLDATAATADVDSGEVSEIKPKKKKKKKKAETAAADKAEELDVRGLETQGPAVGGPEPPKDKGGSEPGVGEMVGSAIGAVAGAPVAVLAVAARALESAKEEKMKGTEEKKKKKKVLEKAVALPPRQKQSEEEEEAKSGPSAAPASADACHVFGIKEAMMTVFAAVRFKRKRQPYLTYASTCTEGEGPVVAASATLNTPSPSPSTISEDSEVVRLKLELEKVRARLQAATEEEVTESESASEADVSDEESVHSFVSSESLSGEDEDLSDESSAASWANMRDNLLERHARLQNLIGTVKKSFQQLSDKELADRAAIRAEHTRLTHKDRTPRVVMGGLGGLEVPPVERNFNTYMLLQAQPVAVHQYVDHYAADRYTRVFHQPAARTPRLIENEDPSNFRIRKKASYEGLYFAPDDSYSLSLSER